MVRTAIEKLEAQPNADVVVCLPDGSMHKPSLAFYLEANFPKTSYTNKIDSASTVLNNHQPSMIVTDSTGMDAVKNVPGILFHSVRWWNTDKQLREQKFWVGYRK